jgi:leucyl/phenylalanyl-tRNA--protein transferase
VVFSIPRQHLFPDPALAEPNGLLGVGGDLDPNRLILAYRQGIFPWYSHAPILWWSPNPRMVLHSADLHVRRSLAKRIRQARFTITLDRAFDTVIERCASRPRPGQTGTWITPQMMAAYRHLHALGYAHSCEAWQDGTLVGGLYGVAIGKVYSGESMFTDVPDASKVAFVHFVRQLHRWKYPLIDCQVYTEHLANFGAGEMPRHLYLEKLHDLQRLEGRQGPWTFDSDFDPLAPLTEEG